MFAFFPVSMSIISQALTLQTFDFLREVYLLLTCVHFLTVFFFDRLVGEKLDSCYLLFCIHYRFPNVSVVSRISLFLHAFVQFCSFM